jgi:thiamine-phosphate diphosphorylase
VVVNDRLDVALASGADGVHLRGDSIPPGSARSIAPPGFLIGRSVHHVEEARAVAPDVDYLVAGTVFPTSSKAGRTEWLGVEGLGRICRSVSVPVLAIGGMTPDRLADVATSGAAGVAAIGLFASENRSLADVVVDARTAWARGYSV